MSIIQKTPWTRQPQFPVAIDPKWINAGLVALFDQNGRNLVDQKLSLADVGTFTKRFTASGIGLSNGGTAYKTASGSIANLIAPRDTAFTVLGVVAPNTTGLTNTYFAQQSGTNQIGVIYGYVANSIEFFAPGFTGSDPRTGSALVISDALPHNFCYSYDGSNWSGCLDGKVIFNTPRTFNLQGSRTGGVLYAASGGVSPTNATFNLWAVFNAGVPLAVQRQLTENPWQLFAPLPRGPWAPTEIPGITFDAASNSGYQSASAGYSWSHTCSGDDRYLVVGISLLSVAQTVTAMTYNGVTMALLFAQSSATGAARIEIWGLAAPAIGTNTISATLSGSIASAGNASSYNGVHQTSPTEGAAGADATNTGAADATVNVTTTADKDFVVDIVATDDVAITVGAGQTQTGNVTGAGGSGAMSYEGPKTPAGSVTMSWTNVGALATWVTGGIALRPVTASTLGGSFISNILHGAAIAIKGYFA